MQKITPPDFLLPLLPLKPEHQIKHTHTWHSPKKPPSLKIPNQEIHKSKEINMI